MGGEIGDLGQAVVHRPGVWQVPHLAAWIYPCQPAFRYNINFNIKINSSEITTHSSPCNFWWKLTCSQWGNGGGRQRSPAWRDRCPGTASCRARKEGTSRPSAAGPENKEKNNHLKLWGNADFVQKFSAEECHQPPILKGRTSWGQGTPEGPYARSCTTAAPSTPWVSNSLKNLVIANYREVQSTMKLKCDALRMSNMCMMLDWSIERTVDEDVAGRLAEWHEGDVDEPQRLVDHLQKISCFRRWSHFLLLISGSRA